MYLEHFGLREPPFRITPHTEFFFPGANRGATLDALLYAITHDEGIVKVSGEVGSGKTMLCRMLLERLPANVETVYLANPMLSRDEIPLAIAAELGLPLERGQRLLGALQDRLLEIYADGRQVVVLIDEAQAMPAEALEEIRLLSNLESKQHKLLQIVLFGQPELDQRLSATDMRQLNERITHRFRLAALSRNDVGVYLDFRLRAAGYHGPDPFTPAAVRLISRASEGLTRRINILADKALLAAYAEGRHEIGRREANAAIRDAEFRPLGRRYDTRQLWAAGIAAAAVIGLGALLAGQTDLRHQALARLGALPTNRMPSAPADDIEASATHAPTLSLAERIAATEEWLQKTPDSHSFIQLLLTDADNEREVDSFIERQAGILDARQIRVYRASSGGRSRLGVIYGDFPTRSAANAVLAALAENLPSGKPYVRSVGKLRQPPREDSRK